MPEKLNTFWTALAGKYTHDEKLVDALFEEIKEKYSVPSRYYHNLEHTEALLLLSENYAGDISKKDILDFSIFYHDIIYNVFRKDNEARSALLSANRLQKAGVPAGIINPVKLFIHCTATHTIPPTAEHKQGLAYFLDMDRAILGDEWNHYLEYTQKIRQEYRVYPDWMYRSGRRKFLLQYLQREFIYYTPAFREKYEFRARLNLEKELSLYGRP